MCFTGLIACNLYIYVYICMFLMCCKHVKDSFINTSFVALGCSGSFSEYCRVHSVLHAFLSHVQRVLLRWLFTGRGRVPQHDWQPTGPVGTRRYTVARRIPDGSGNWFLERSETVLKQPSDPARACHLAQPDFPAPQRRPSDISHRSCRFSEDRGNCLHYFILSTSQRNGPVRDLKPRNLSKHELSVVESVVNAAAERLTWKMMEPSVMMAAWEKWHFPEC